MKIDKVEIIGFRGILKEEIQLGRLAVFQGEMGIGKTSKLLAILYGLTGSAPSGLNLDDLINIHSDFMWVRISGENNRRFFLIERRKRRNQATSMKFEGEVPANIGEKSFIEGREIAKLFTGTSSEKTLKIDELLGLSYYDQIASEISTAPIERRIKEVEELRELGQQSKVLKESTSKTEREIENVNQRLNAIELRLKEKSKKYAVADQTLKEESSKLSKAIEFEGRKKLLEQYKSTLTGMKPVPKGLEEELSELEARFTAMQRRVTFLEAAMQTLDLEGKKVEEMRFCPLCGSLISRDQVQKFGHYEEEYREYIARSTELERLVNEKRNLAEDIRKQVEAERAVRAQISALEQELEEFSTEAIQMEVLEDARRDLKEREELIRERDILSLRHDSLTEQLTTFKSMLNKTRTDTIDFTLELQRLGDLRDKVARIKKALLESINESRAYRVEKLRSSFMRTFMGIYPYNRFKDIDLELTKVRGRETLVVKGSIDGNHIYSQQMSTGENVAISFALLFAVNELENAPILLLDEPEEGLDEKGIAGLVEVLQKLKESTQVVIAARNRSFAELLQGVAS